MAFCTKHHLVPTSACNSYNLRSSHSSHPFLFTSGSRKLIHFSRHSISERSNPRARNSSAIRFQRLDENRGCKADRSSIYCIGTNVPQWTSNFFWFFAWIKLIWKSENMGKISDLIFNIMSFCPWPYLRVSECPFRRQTFISVVVTLKKVVVIIFDF